MIRAVLLFLFLFISAETKKTLDPYKVLGVDKTSSQRDIQKAFHKLSLQYHPDKNKAKGAQEKFSEINDAYEILSDEEKRKNYDLYGDERGNAGFDEGNFGNHAGYSHFSNGGSGNSFFTSNPGGWQNMGGHGKSFSFSFGGDSGAGRSPFGFDFGDMFSSFFGGRMKGGAGSSGFGRAQSSSSGIIEDVNIQFFNKEIQDQGLTWLLLFYNPSGSRLHEFESIVEEAATSLTGAVKAGRVNCQSEQKLCKNLGVSVLKRARLLAYSYRTNDEGSLVEYNGALDYHSLKSFCQQQLPKFSRRIELNSFALSSSSTSSLPQILLLSTKKDTPVIWRVVSGLCRKQFLFFDTEVHDVSHPILKTWGIHELPAIVGRTTNGEEHVLKQGILVKDLSSGITDLRTLLRSFENKNKKASSGQSRRASQSDQGRVPILISSNVGSICSEKNAVCIIGAFRSSKSKEKLETILSEISQKTLVRRQSRAQDIGSSISYCLLDASKQSAFLYAFDRLGYKSLDKFLVAYKPKRGKFAAFTDEITLEATERFVGSVMNGDVQFSKIRKQPVVQ